MVDTIISKSAYLWDLMKLFYIEIYDLLCAKVELFIFVNLLFVLKVGNKTKEKEFKTKEDVNLIFSSIIQKRENSVK